MLTQYSIKNPLVGIPKDRLLSEAAGLATKHGLNDAVDDFKRGALAAQHPEKFETIVELTDQDRQLLKNEIEHRWKHPKALYFAIFMNSISAAIQGWDQTGSNGANLSYPQVFNIASSGEQCEAMGTCSRNSWIIGAINSAPYMAICVM